MEICLENQTEVERLKEQFKYMDKEDIEKGCAEYLMGKIQESNPSQELKLRRRWISNDAIEGFCYYIIQRIKPRIFFPRKIEVVNFFGDGSLVVLNESNLVKIAEESAETIRQVLGLEELKIIRRDYIS